MPSRALLALLLAVPLAAQEPEHDESIRKPMPIVKHRHALPLEPINPDLVVPLPFAPLDLRGPDIFTPYVQPTPPNARPAVAALIPLAAAAIAFSGDDNTPESVVPEPASLLLVGTGLAGVLRLRRGTR